MAKKITVHEWDGMLLSLFQMDAGDKIERHSHPFQHTTGVARGRTRVCIFYPEDPKVFEGGFRIEHFTMIPGDRDFAFPASIEHEIQALEDGTIIVNLSHSQGTPGKEAERGGVQLEDGTVIYDS